MPPQGKHYTYADYLTWDEQDHLELIEGTPIMMSPPSRAHQKASGEIFRQIANYLDGKKCEIYAAPFAVRLFAQQDSDAASIDTVVEPDISVICDRDKLDDQGCKGARLFQIRCKPPEWCRIEASHRRLYIKLVLGDYCSILYSIFDWMLWRHTGVIIKNSFVVITTDFQFLLSYTKFTNIRGGWI